MQLWGRLAGELEGRRATVPRCEAQETPAISVDDDKVSIKIISGQSHGTDSVRDLAYTPEWIFDITIKSGGQVTQQLPGRWNIFAYTLAGPTHFGLGEEQTTVDQYHHVVFEQKGDSIVAEVAKEPSESGSFCK